MDVSNVATGGENCDLRKWPDGQPQRRPYAKPVTPVCILARTQAEPAWISPGDSGGWP